MKNMTSGSPAGLIVRFCMPILLGNLLQLTYSTADIRIVGSFLGDGALAAVGATAVLVSLFTGFFMGNANGYAIITAQRFGANDMRLVKGAIAASLLLGIGLSSVLITSSLLFLHPILDFLQVPADLYVPAAGYMRIMLVGFLVTMLYDVLLASARAVGDSLTPLLTLILSVGLNIAGDLLLIGLFRFPVWGAAAATVGAQVIALLICSVYLVRKYEVFRLKREDFLLVKKDMRFEMITSGLSMGLMSSLICFGSLILQTAINALGASYIVAQSAARKITEIFMSVFVAFGQTLSTYCSQNYGAGEYDRIRRGMRAGYAITCSWCILVLLILHPLAESLVRLITGSSDSIMIEAATKYLRIDSVLYVLVAIIFIQRHSLQGIGDRITPLISSGIEMGGKLVLTLTLVPAMGYGGVILVEPIVWIFMIIPLILQVRKWKKKTFQSEKHKKRI